MVNKKRIGILLLIILALLLAACSSDDPPVGGDETFTLEEIAEYDGLEGRPAYVVVDGIVYDVSSITQWAEGSHAGFAAGQDITEAFQSYHEPSMLDRAKIVGTLED